MIYITLISMFVIIAYTAAVCIKQKGVPNSISATFYTLEHKAWFLVAMWGTAGLLMPAILETSKAGTEWAAFLACAGMLAVGTAPNFKEDQEGTVHTAGAIMCLVFSQVWVALNSPWCLMVWVVYLLATLEELNRRDSSLSIWSDYLRTKPMFWIEIAALLTTYLTLLICI